MIRIPLLLLLAAAAQAQTDWPVYGHDPGGRRYSPLKQIHAGNVSGLREVWRFDTQAPIAPTQPVPPAAEAEAAPASAGAAAAAGPPRRASSRQRVFRSESTPLVVQGIMYLPTPYNRVIALEPETGRKIWEYEAEHNPSMRGIAYWPGDKQLPPQIVFGTSGGWLISLNARTGRPVPGFGVEGKVNLRTGVADKFPSRAYGLSSPPAIYKDIVITGSHTQENPALGPAGDVRGWDIRTGKLLWTFHTIPRPGEPNYDAWKGDQWVDRSGTNSWGLITVDVQRGMIFVPLGCPTTDFWGGDRLGSNLYGSSLVALDAATGKLKWHFQTTHHDNWDYDLQAPPALIEVRRNGKRIPAVAQSTKQALLFILDRETGKPIYEVEERPVLSDNPTPGDEYWPTQPFPVKPLPLARNSFKPEEIATVTPEHEKYCRDLLALEGGALTGGPYAQYGPKLRVIFPSWTGGGNWGGTAFDPGLGYLFVNTKSEGMINKLVQSDDKTTWLRVSPDNAPESLGGVFWDGKKNWSCAQPPWGELSAVNVHTGDIAWRVPLGSFEELDAKGVPQTGTPNMGGPIATAGGLMFIGATVDGKFRAFASRTGKELWSAKLSQNARAVPITYQGRNGKQYVAIMAGGGVIGGAPAAPILHVFALP
jgi:glucose dehydrogenase